MFKKRTPDPAQKEAFGQVVRTVRNSFGLTQENLAKLMNCSVRWLVQVENGESSLNCMDTIRLLAIFELDPAEVAKEVGLHVLVPAGRK